MKKFFTNDADLFRTLSSGIDCLSCWLKSAIILTVVWLFPVHCLAHIKVVNSATELDYPPFSVVLEDGTASGFSVELMRAVLKVTGHDVAFKIQPWNTIKDDLSEGRLEVLPAVGRSPEREHLYDFTVPYITLYGAVFTRDNERSIKRLNDLEGRRIGVMRGDNAEEFMLRSGYADDLVTGTTVDEVLRMLSRGELDAVVVQELVGTSLIKKLGLSNIKPAIAPLKEFSQDFCFAVPKGHQSLLAELNEGLSVVIANGTYERLYDKWIGATGTDGEAAIYYFKMATGLMGLLLVFFVIFFQYQHWKKHNELIISERKYRMLFENLTQGVFYQDSDGVLTSCNLACLELLGLTCDEFKDKRLVDINLKVIRQDGSEYPKDEFPSIQVLKTAKPIQEVIAGLFNQTKQSYVWLSINATPQFREGESKPYQVFVTLHDITDLRSAHEALADERCHLHYILEGTRAGTWEWNVETGVTIFNNRWAEIIGYTLDEISPVSIETWVRFVHPDDLEQSNILMQKHLAGELNYYEHELRIRHKSGQWVWVLDRGKVVSYTDAGEPLWVAGTHIDITTRKLVEESLKKSIVINQTILKTIPDMIWLKGPGGEYLSCNPAFETFLGVNQQDIIGKTDEDLPVQIFRNFTGTAELTNRVPALSNTYTYEEWLESRGDGHKVLMLTTKTCMYDHAGRMIGVLGVARDITDQFNTQEEVRQQENYQRALLDNFPFVVWLKDTESRFLAVNQAFATYVGCSDPNELRGKTDYDVLPYDQAESYWNDDRYVMSSKMKKETIEEIDEGGIHKWYQTYKAPIFGKNNEIIGTVGLSHDITSLKNAEETRVSTLEMQRDQLVREVNHRIKNHLQGLIGLLGHRKTTSDINDDLVDEVISQICSIAMVYGLQTEHVHGEIQFKNMLDAIIASISGMSQISLSVQYETDLEKSYVDQEKAVALSLVINELIMNSVKHAKRSDAAVSVIIKCKKQNSSISLMISNHGCLPDNFDFQSGRGCGTGLELAKAMLPSNGASLSIFGQHDEVFSELKLAKPLLKA